MTNDEDYVWAKGVPCRSLTIMEDGKFTEEGRAYLEQRREQRRGWRAGMERAAQIVCPQPHVEEERRCEDVAATIRREADAEAWAEFGLTVGEAITYRFHPPSWWRHPIRRWRWRRKFGRPRGHARITSVTETKLTLER